MTGTQVTAPTRDPSALQRVFSFPNPVNEVSARVVAGGVLLVAIGTIVSGFRWMIFVLVYGFLARVLTGPTLSPLGQVATRIVTPRLPVRARHVPGPPKRFAQGMGLAFAVTALMLSLAGFWTAATVVLSCLAAAAFLEAAFGLCLGCTLFGFLMRRGVVSAAVCERCHDIWARPGD